MDFQNQMNQANNLFQTHGNNPQEFINNLKSMSNSGNDMAKASVELFCMEMKKKGLDNLDGYDGLCNGASITQVRRWIYQYIFVLRLLLFTKMYFPKYIQCRSFL